MLLLPINYETGVQCLLFTVAFEFFRILLGYLIARRPSKLRELQNEKLDLTLELSQIRSVQVEFVKHSLISRKMIKVDKQIESIQDAHAPRVASTRKAGRIVRVVVYVCFCSYHLYIGSPVLAIVESKLFWPLSAVLPETVGLPVWSSVILLGISIRHILRSFLSVVGKRSDFP